jgi:hypothetical protein
MQVRSDIALLNFGFELGLFSVIPALLRSSEYSLSRLVYVVNAPACQIGNWVRSALFIFRLMPHFAGP